MKSQALFVLGSALLVAGCSSNSSTGPSATPTTRVALQSSPVAQPSQHVSTKPTATPRSSTGGRGAGGDPHGNPYQRGSAFLKAGKYAQAAAAFKQAISKHLNTFGSQVGLGTAEEGLHDYHAALSAYRKAVPLQPKNAFVQYRAAFSALYAGDFHAAVFYATNYISLRPKDVAGYHLRFVANGDLLLHKQQVVDATYEVNLEPHSARSYNDLGIALTNDRQYKKASVAFGKAIALQPNNAEYYMNRGVEENLSSKFSLALRDLERARALTRDPALRKRLDSAIAYLKHHPHG